MDSMSIAEQSSSIRGELHDFMTVMRRIRECCSFSSTILGVPETSEEVIRCLCYQLIMFSY